MPRLRAPGVYYEPADPPPRRIAAVRTDIAGFVGVADRGPLHVPVRIESWTQFATRFGEHLPEGFLAYAVRGFFANGGRRCWIVRVGAADADSPRASLLLANRAGRPVFEVTARDHGPGAEKLAVRVESAPGGKFSLFIELSGQVIEVWRDLDSAPELKEGEKTKNRFAPDVINGTTLDGAERGQPDEAERSELGSVFIEIQPYGEEKDRFPIGVNVQRQMLRRRIRVEGDSPDTERYRIEIAQATHEVRRTGFLGWHTRAVPVLSGLTLEHFTGENQKPDRRWGLKALERVEEVALVAMPDLSWPGFAPPPKASPRPRRCHVLTNDDTFPNPDFEPSDDRLGFDRAVILEGQRAVLRHCATLRDRFAILDVPAAQSPEAAIRWASGSLGGDGLRSEAGQFGALYYPWIYAPEPRLGPNVRRVPPSGHIAGMFARVDLSQGVQKPPANEVLEDVRGVEVEIDARDHGWLNDEGVNAIRPCPGRGVRVMGARTLVPPALNEFRHWRYVQVRRLLSMIEEAIARSAQWVVFEDNRPERRREVDRVVRTFLDEQWRRGRFDGATAEDAYRVACDDSTNPLEAAEAAQLICEIAVRPPLPAEFVVVRIGRPTGETGAADFRGASDA